MFRPLVPALALALATGPAVAQSCGGEFGSFVEQMKQEAVSRGMDATTVDDFFDSVRYEQSVIDADRRQTVFQTDFLDFSKKLISANRKQNAARYAEEYDSLFDEIEAEYGVPRGILLAFWAFETDFGQVQGDTNTANALVTLAHDCRRPELFRPQVFAALELFERGDFEPASETGAWAGEIGQVQMLPEDILTNGRDGDGDGHVRLKRSTPDALVSGAAMLSDLGWRANEPWLTEVRLPDGFDVSLSGLPTTKIVGEWQAMGIEARQGSLGGQELPASVILPNGEGGPAFLAYPNFEVLFEWNESFVYVLTAAYFASRIEGAPVYDEGNPQPGLSGDQMRALQEKLQARGYDVGGADGVLGAKTREAVRAVQAELGLPQDAWPTRDLLNSL